MTTQPTGSSTTTTTTTASTSIPLSRQVLSGFRVSKIFKDNVDGQHITSLDYDDKGEFCLTSSNDESLHLYDCRQGKHVKVLYSKKYGVHLARFTHRSNNAIYASTKNDDTIRYLSLHDNQYLRYFKGHKKRVVALDMSPLDDQFISGAMDDTVRLWDLRSTTCQGLVNITGRPCVAFDQSGLVFAIALHARQTICLYDVKNFDKEPFATFTINDKELEKISYPPVMPLWTSVQFNNTGKLLLVLTAGDVHYVLDGYEGTLMARLVGHYGMSKAGFDTISSGQEASWTPDGRFIVGGSADGKICMWDTQSAKDPVTGNLKPMQVLEGHAGTGPARVVQFNPKSMMMASACSELAMWLPENTS